MKKKIWMALFLTGMISAGFTGCKKQETPVPGNDSAEFTKIYDGNTVIHTSYGKWTPPKGSRRLSDGNIVDAQGCVIGNDGTFRYRGGGVG